jgi:hypothetical protein
MEFNTKGTNQKLWVFGDSFTGMCHGENGVESWMWLLYKSFVGNNLHISSKGSRDVQNVIDIFLRNLKDIKNDDLVILMLPTISRFRLPLKYPSIDVEMSNIARTATEKMKHLDYFIGNGFYSSTITSGVQENNELEEPLNLVDYNNFGHVPPNEVPNTTSIVCMINSSNANKKNTNDILRSFLAYFPFKLIIYSWTNELDNTLVNTKEVIENRIGFWHTLSDEYNESNGEIGRKDDHHWSKKMDKAFSEYIINEYPEYFKKS